MEEVEKFKVQSLYPLGLIVVSAILLVLVSPRVIDSAEKPSLMEDNFSYIVAWLLCHVFIGWSSATISWNRLIQNLDAELTPSRFNEGKTKHQERVDSLGSFSWGTGLASLVGLAWLALPVALSFLNVLTDGYPIRMDSEQRVLQTLFLSMFLFAFTYWIFLNQRLVSYYFKIRPKLIEE